MGTIPTYHPSVDRIAVGELVAYRDDTGQGNTGRIIGWVDKLSEGGGARWAIVSWPARDTPTARVDERGRRGQAFTLASLMHVPTGTLSGCTAAVQRLYEPDTRVGDDVARRGILAELEARIAVLERAQSAAQGRG